MWMKVSVVLVSLMLLTAACKKAEEAPEESAPTTPMTETVAPDTASPAETAAAEATPPSATIPADFPQEVPLYPGATVMAATKNPDGSFLVKLESADDPQKVADDFKQAMAAKGWESTSSMSMGTATMLKYKLAQRELTANISKLDTGKTEINMTVGEALVAAPTMTVVTTTTVTLPAGTAGMTTQTMGAPAVTTSTEMTTTTMPGTQMPTTMTMPATEMPTTVTE